jgi:phage gp36-like protein
MGYATLADATTYGLVPSAYGLNITTAQIQSNLDAASAWADTCLRGRYKPCPLLPPFDPALVRAVVHIARYEILSLRGFVEDKNVIDSRDAAVVFLNEVERQSKHLAVAADAVTPSLPSPLVTSSSTISFNTTTTSSNRGW